MHQAVERIEHDSDGVWAYLKKGWCAEPAEHAIHEDTLAQVKAKYHLIHRCDCAECQPVPR